MANKGDLVGGKLLRYLTIRNSLFAIVGILVSAIVIFSVSSAIDGVKKGSEARRVVADNQISEAFLVAARHWSVERGAMNTALNFADPADPGVPQDDGGRPVQGRSRL